MEKMRENNFLCIRLCMEKLRENNFLFIRLSMEKTERKSFCIYMVTTLAGKAGKAGKWGAFSKKARKAGKEYNFQCTLAGKAGISFLGSRYF